MPRYHRGVPAAPPGTRPQPSPSPGCTSLSPSSICRWVFTTSKGSVSTAATCRAGSGAVSGDLAIPAQRRLCRHSPAPSQPHPLLPPPLTAERAPAWCRPQGPQTHRPGDGPRGEADHECGLIQPGLSAEPFPHQLIVKPVESWEEIRNTSATEAPQMRRDSPRAGLPCPALVPISQCHRSPCPPQQPYPRRGRLAARWVPSPSRGTASRPEPPPTGCRHPALGS